MIITNNEEALRIHCQDVSPDEVGTLIETLENELKYANRLGKNGIGLAAPQIGIGKKAAIIRMDNININLVNCRIVNGYYPTMFRSEGCLSFPGRVEDTTRFIEIHLADNLVRPDGLIASGLAAVVCQHEIDHWSGKLFFDYKINKPPVKLKPNDPCVCGVVDPQTGKPKKFKKCCGR